MDVSARYPVVVGVDGSPESRVAAELAALEALRRGVSLLVVTGYPAPPVRYEPDEAHWQPKAQAHEVGAEAVERIRGAHPDLTVDATEEGRELAEALIDHSHSATLVAVCAEHAGGLFSRSAATRTATDAHCPVLVVRPERPGPVVVGLDGSDHGAATVAAGFEEAALRRVGLRAVHVWCEPSRPSESRDRPATSEGEASRLVGDALLGWSEKYPDVEATRVPVRGADPGRELAATDAGLIVVGARGRSAPFGPMLGSVSRNLVHHAAGPVLITR